MPLTLDQAAEVFARGFASMRNRTRPCIAERSGPLWVVRDGPTAKEPTRVEEWVATDLTPAQVDRLARRGTHGRFKVCALRRMDEPDAPLREGYKRLGYRLQAIEAFFVHDLKGIPTVKSPVKLVRVRTQALADRLAKVTRARQILPEQLIDPRAPVRQYAALDEDGEPIGWVQSIVVGRRTWVANMAVVPAHRRRGIARALMAKMLRDDRAAGAKASALLASRAGAQLYPVVGYRQIGELLLFTPGKQGG